MTGMGDNRAEWGSPPPGGQPPQYQQPQYPAPGGQQPQYPAPGGQQPQYPAPQQPSGPPPQYQQPQYPQPPYPQAPEPPQGQPRYPQAPEPAHGKPQYPPPPGPQYPQPEYPQPQYPQPPYPQAPQPPYGQPQYPPPAYPQPPAYQQPYPPQPYPQQPYQPQPNGPPPSPYPVAQFPLPPGPPQQPYGEPIVVPIEGTGVAKLAAKIKRRALVFTPEHLAHVDKQGEFRIAWSELSRVIVTTAYHQDSFKLLAPKTWRVRVIMEVADPGFAQRHPGLAKLQGKFGAAGPGSYGLPLGPVENRVGELVHGFATYGRQVFGGVIEEGQVIGFGYL